MIEKYVFKINGEPVPKGRPRFIVRNGFVQTYTPNKTKAAENAISAQLKTQYNKKPLDCPCMVKITFAFSVPKSYSKKRRAQIEQEDFAHYYKPDADNVAKLVLDAMNKIIFHDDCQISTLAIQKTYTFDEPYTEIEVTGIRKDLTNK